MSGCQVKSLANRQQVLWWRNPGLAEYLGDRTTHPTSQLVDMVTLERFRKLALDLPHVETGIHFSLVMFGVGTKNFASFDPRTGQLALKLPLLDPKRGEAIDRGLLSPVPGKYGAQGWVAVDLDAMGESEFVALLKTAHGQVELDRTKHRNSKPSRR